MRTALLSASLLLFALIAAGPAGATFTGPPLAPDPTFGDAGVVRTVHRLAAPVLGQSGGRVYVAGDGSVFRFAPDGSADSTFGGDGSGETRSLANGARLAADLIISSRSAVFTISTTTSRSGPAAGYGMEVIRQDPDGLLDPLFGGSGIVGTRPGAASSFPSRATATGTALDIDSGRGLLVAGGVNVERPRAAIAAVTRLKQNGSVDRDFGIGGSFRLRSDGPGSAEFTDILVMPGGRTLVAGVFGKRIAVTELDRRGRLVPSFGRNGFTVVGTTVGPGPPFVGASGPGAELAIGSGGQIFVLHGAAGSNRVTALREDGLRLRYFGNNGTIGFRSGNWGLDWKAIHPLSGGRVLLAGSHYRARGGPPARRSAMLVLGTDGTRFTDFGENGLWRNVTPGTGGFSDVTLAPRGTLVLAGTTGPTGSRGRLVLSRFLTVPAGS